MLFKMQLKDTENFTENSKEVLGIHSLKKQKDGLVDERRNGQRVDGVEGKIK